MYRILSTSKSGMNAYQSKIDTISNNLANSTTTGYKKVNVAFQDLMTETLNRQGYKTNTENTVMGTGTKSVDLPRDNSQGNLQVTSLSTDIALDGQGYFKVTSDGGEAYTRDGNFKIDSLGRLVDAYGNKLQMNYVNGFSEDNVRLTADNFSVNTSGDVYVKMGESFQKIAEIPVYTAVGDGAFASIGQNLFVPTEGAQVERTTTTSMYQGYLEMSNVDMSTEMTDLIVAQRAYQMAGKGITTADEMLGMINNMRSR